MSFAHVLFFISRYGVEAPEAVLRLRSDPEIDRLLGLQVGGWAGGWAEQGREESRIWQEAYDVAGRVVQAQHSM